VSKKTAAPHEPAVFGGPLLGTPALQRSLIFNDLALSQERRRCWTTPALALILALKTTLLACGSPTIRRLALHALAHQRRLTHKGPEDQRSVWGGM
jgi:hypothetical protein